MNAHRPIWIGLGLALLLAIGIAVLAAGSSLVAQHAGQPAPTPASAVIERFVPQVDREFGYKMLRPAGWEEINLGDARGYASPGSTGKADRVVRTAVSMQTVAQMMGGASGQIATLNQFRHNPSLAGWTQARERAWQAQGIAVTLERRLPHAAISADAPANGGLQPIGYVVDQDQPLVISLKGHGTYSTLTALRANGLLDDFRGRRDRPGPGDRHGDRRPTRRHDHRRQHPRLGRDLHGPIASGHAVSGAAPGLRSPHILRRV